MPILPRQITDIAQPGSMYFSEIHLPVSDLLLQQFYDWATRIRDRKVLPRTARYYVKLVREYAGVLNLKKIEREKVFSNLTPKLRSWIKDALLCYGKFLDDLYDFDEPFYYDYVSKKLRIVKRYRWQGTPEAPSVEEVVALLKAAMKVSPRCFVFLSTKAFSGLRTEHLKLVVFASFICLGELKVCYQPIWDQKETNKLKFVAVLPYEIVAFAVEHEIPKPTYKKYDMYIDFAKARELAKVNITVHDLRSFANTYLLAHGLQRFEVNFILGRLTPGIDIKHYIDMIHEELAKAWARKYRKAVEPLLRRLGLVRNANLNVLKKPGSNNAGLYAFLS